MSTKRLDARGPNGEACTIVCTTSRIDTSNLSGRSSLAGLPEFRLATGDRLNPTDDPKVFRSLDGVDRYTLT